MSDLVCNCIKCFNDRIKASSETFTVNMRYSFRYACELCGNKRCPHHSDHEISCTNSNEPGQPGSVYT